MTTVRLLAEDDHDAWAPLWTDYLSFYRHEGEPPDTFGRLLSEESLVGLLAVGSEGRAIGLAHLVIHASTWSDRPVGYLNDLFVARSERGRGAGRALIEATYEQARRRGCSEVYWHTQEFNAPARSLYDTVAGLTSFRVYEHEL